MAETTATDRSMRGCVLRAATVALALLCALTLGGCKDTDALKEIVYDQRATVIDYENPTKFFISDESAEETSDAVAAAEVSEDAEPTDEVQNLVVYSSEPNTTGFTAKKSAFADPADFPGIEASETVCFVPSEDPNAFDHEATVVEEAASEEREDEQAPQTTSAGDEANPDGENREGESSGSSKKSKAEKTDKGATAGGDNQIAAEEKDEKSNGTESPEADTAGPDRKKDPTRVIYDASDPNQDPPQVERIAAFGPYAAMVQMIGGTGALAATDATTLKSDFKTVFDTSGISKGWKDDGTAQGMNVNALVKSGAEVILVTDSSYLDDLSDADFEKLRKAHIHTVLMYDMSSSQNIKANVNTVGSLLQGSKKAAYGDTAEDRAADYVAFHDRVVKACADAAGGMALKSSSKQVYQSSEKGDKDVGKNTEPRYTLLIDEYVKGAKYVGEGQGDANWKPASGMAFAGAGYGTTPVSYYMQVGGLINNAAAQTTMGSAGKVPVWQFQLKSFPFKAKEWSGIDLSLMEGIANLDRSLLDSGVNVHSVTDMGEGLGCPSFPKVIVTKGSIKEALVENSKKDHGLYHPYDYSQGAEIGSVGPSVGDTVIYTCIGGVTDDDPTNVLSQADAFEQVIEVNPSGLFCDWTEGTVESFLEAAWVCDVVNDEASGVSWEQEAKDFYQTFYGYDVDPRTLADQ